MPEGRIQILTHRTEPMVWQPRWLSHPNGALGCCRIMIAVADPEEAAQRFARFTARKCNAIAAGLDDRARPRPIDLVAADAFAQMLPEVAIPALPFAGAYGIKVRSLASLGKS